MSFYPELDPIKYAEDLFAQGAEDLEDFPEHLWGSLYSSGTNDLPYAAKSFVREVNEELSKLRGHVAMCS